MAIKTYDDTNFIMIANAIRAKNGLETQYKPSEMATAINAFKMAKDVEPNNTSSGLNVNFKDGADGEKYNSLILNIPPLQDGTGDPSPTNKRAFKDYARFVVNYSGADTSDYETYTLNHSTLGGSIDLISGAESYFNVAMRLANYSNSITTYTENGVTIFYLPNASSFGDIYSESLKTVEKMSSLSEAAANMPNNSIAGAKDAAVGTIGFFIRADSFSTVSELIASIGMDDNYPTTWMETNTITSGLFTGRTELGVNNLWAIGYQVYDEQLSQDIPLEVSYKADPTLYTQGQIYETVKDLLPQDTASGAVANFPDGSDGYPIVEGIFNIEPYQEGTGDPSPSNVRPISGFTDMEITKVGKNLYPATKVTIYNRNGLTYENSIFIKKGLYTASLSNLTNATSWRFCFRVYNLEENIVTNAKANGYVSSTALSDTYDSNITLMQGANSTLTSLSFEILKDCYIACGLSSGDVSSSTTFDYQLEVGSTASSYEAFKTPEVISVDWADSAGTVYVGELNLTTGEITVTHILKELDYNSNWTYEVTSNKKNFYVSIGADIKGGQYSATNGFYCNASLPSTQNGSQLNTCFISNAKNFNYTWGDTLNLSSAQEFKNYLETNNLVIQVVAQLVTPVTYQLTPQEIKTLLGVNNIWCNTGDSEIKYRADIALYIDKISNS